MLQGGYKQLNASRVCIDLEAGPQMVWGRDLRPCYTHFLPRAERRQEYDVKYLFEKYILMNIGNHTKA